MPYINKPIDRSQVMFTTFAELVEPDSTARVINYFIDHVDLGEMGFKNTTAAEGRLSFPPSNMAKLYLYGYRNKIRSSRKLERACKINIEAMWLMEGLTPDFRVISDFRKDNIDCMKKLYHEFTKRVTIRVFIKMVRFHTASRGWKSAMSYNGVVLTGESLWFPYQASVESAADCTSTDLMKRR